MRLESVCPRRRVEKMLCSKGDRAVGCDKRCSGRGPFWGREGHRCRGSAAVGLGGEPSLETGAPEHTHRHTGEPSLTLPWRWALPHRDQSPGWCDGQRNVRAAWLKGGDSWVHACDSVTCDGWWVIHEVVRRGWAGMGI